MDQNPLRRLEALGQSVWLDTIRRGMFSSGELQRLITEDGLSGVTANPSIFEKAIAGSHDYDEAVAELANGSSNPQSIYETLAVQDVQTAADLFRPIYDRTGGRDGFVSLEVSPRLAHDTEGSLAEARRLWAALDRPNVMIKIPGTREGVPAIRRAIAEGININVTLLFGLTRYEEVIDAYASGLEDRTSAGQPIDHIASVASFFLSRIDVLVDPMLERLMRSGNQRGHLAAGLRGQVAIASARVAYQIHQERMARPRFKALAEQGAHGQRLLWASTSTKNPAYSDVKYVEPLIGPWTINTMPMETIHAYRDHGQPSVTITDDLPEARQVLNQLEQAGINIDQVTQQLEDEGVQKFDDAFDKLLAALSEKSRTFASAQPAHVDSLQMQLGEYDEPVQRRVERLAKHDFADRLWRKDARLWRLDARSKEKIRNSLGWLHLPDKMDENLGQLRAFADEVHAAGFERVVQMGMGDASTAPLVFARCFSGAGNHSPHGLPVDMLDTTDPGTICGIEERAPQERTLFIVASQSGTTPETLAFADYFYERIRSQRGDRAGEQFVAITCNDTPLARQARERGFRRTFTNYVDAPGAYAALSYASLVPACLMGVNVGELLQRSLRMEHACTASVPIDQNPGVRLGAVLGELARRGRDKVTLFVARPVAPLGQWIKQVLAQSTGKDGHGIIPVPFERIGPASVYSDDRVFVQVRMRGGREEEFDRGMDELAQAGHPCIVIEMADALDLGQEFVRWEFAAATAAAIFGVNAFDRPAVREIEEATQRMLADVQRGRPLPEPRPTATRGHLRMYAQQHARTTEELLKSFLSAARPGDYLTLQAFLPEHPAVEERLQSLRARLRDQLRVATTRDYAPRALQVMGELYTQGPDRGMILQLTSDARDVADDTTIPQRHYTFGTLNRAAALSEMETLNQHRRRVLRVDLGPDIEAGLAELAQSIDEALM